jgi:hypothetical protein
MNSIESKFFSLYLTPLIMLAFDLDRHRHLVHFESNF